MGRSFPSIDEATKLFDNDILDALRKIFAGADTGSAAIFPQPAEAVMHGWFAARTGIPTTIAFVGSSTTNNEGTSAATEAYVAKLTAEIQAAYPSGLSDETSVTRLATAGRSKRPGIHAVNGGVGGASSANYLSSQTIGQIAALVPGVVFHMVGSNDWRNSVPLETYRTNMRNQLAALDAAIGSQPHMHVLIHQNPSADVTRPIAWADYGRVLAEVAAEDTARRMFVDISTGYGPNGWPGNDPLDLVSPDSIHQTDRGHAFMADMLKRTLRLAPAPRGEVVVSDNFRRPESPVVMADTGQLWVSQGTAAATTQGNQFTVTSAGTFLIETRHSDVDASVFLVAAANTPGLLFRSNDEDNRMGIFFFTGSGHLALYQKSNGNNVEVIGADLAPRASAYLRVVAVGDTVRAYVDGALAFTYVMPAADFTKFGAFTKSGLRDASAGTKFEGFVVKQSR